MSAGVWFDEDNYWKGTRTNECGLRAGHAYSLIAAFELKDNLVYETITCTNLDDADPANRKFDSNSAGCDAYTDFSMCGTADDADFTSSALCCMCNGGQNTSNIVQPFDQSTNGTLAHELYMLRNPLAYQNFTGKWGGSFCNSDTDVKDKYGDTCDWYDRYPN